MAALVVPALRRRRAFGHLDASEDQSHTCGLQLGKNRLIVIFGLIAVTGAWLAWNNARRNREAAAAAATLNLGSDWQKRAPAPPRKIPDRSLPAAAALPASRAAKSPGATPSLGPAPGPALEAPPAEAANLPPTPSPAPTAETVALESYYAGLFRRLNFSPDQVAQFRSLREEASLDALDALTPAERDQLATDPAIVRQVIMATESGLDTQIQSQFGDAIFARYKQDQQTFSQRVTIDQLEQSLRSGSAPLTDAQANQLVQILARTEAPGPKVLYSRITVETINEAAPLLTPEQLQALQLLAQQQQAGTGN